MPDSFSPSFELTHAVEVIVPLFGALVSGEPVLVIPAVQPDVSDRRRGAVTGPDGPPDHWLINVAEADAQAVEHLVDFRLVPGLMPDFQHQRVFQKLHRQPANIFPVLLAVLE